MLIMRTTVLKTSDDRTAPAGMPMATTVPLDRTYWAAWVNGFWEAASSRTAWAPSPSGVLDLTSSITSGEEMKSTYAW